LRYEPQTTFPHLKNAGVMWLARMGIDVSAESVVATCGAHHGLFLALSTEAKYGDTVLTEAHTYFGLIEIASLLGLKLVSIAADREGMIPTALDAACRRGNPRLLFCNPTVQNPTATTMPEDRRYRILAIAERHDLTIIEDDVLQPLVSDPPPLLKSLAPERCHLITSVSKVLAPGLRVGFAVPPARSRTRFIESLRTHTLMLPTLPLAVVATWLKDGTADRTMRLAKQEARARQQLAEYILPKDFVYVTPVSYFIWLQLPEQWTPSRLAAEAARYGVHVLPSELFAVDTANAANAVRFVVGRSVSRVVLKESLEILRGLLESGPSGRMSAAMMSPT
jgi:DNA-binding transcriptional MocR family regulator